MLKVRWTRKDKDDWITDYVSEVTWGGSDTQTSRTASISIISNPYKKINLNIKIGELIYLYENEKCIFIGVITSRERSGDIGTVSYNCKDFMHYFTKSKNSYSFKKKRPEDITRQICNDLQVMTTDVYKTKKKVPKILFEDETYYNMIVKSYNKAAKKISAKAPPVFMPTMKNMKLAVIIKGKYCGIELKSDADIMQSHYGENNENMINKVYILNDKGKRVGTVKNNSSIKKYGVYQETYKKEEGINPKNAAKRLLQGISKEATLETVGHVACRAGYALKIKDSATGLTGKFYIESDQHTFKEGVHTMSLNLKFANELEEA